MLYNKTKKKKLSQNIELADSFLKRLRGLMFTRRKKAPLVFVFPVEDRVRASVHNLFVFYSIDLIYLNAGKKVVDIKRNFVPGSLNYTPLKAAKYLIETPSGMIKEVAVGEQLEFSEKQINDVESKGK